MNKGPKTSVLGICVWSVAIIFFLYEYFLRVLPATAAKSIMESLHLSLEQFSVIGSGYYITYALMQVPVGILLDRFSVKKLITAACALCSVGIYLFALSEQFFVAFGARLMIGLGSSFGYVSLMVLALNWFPRKHFAFLNGLGLFLGCLGPVVAGAPIAHLIEYAPGGWREVFTWCAYFGVALTIVVFAVIKGKQRHVAPVIFVARDVSIGKQLKSLLANLKIWWVYISGALTYVTIPVLGAFWGTTYLVKRGFITTDAAFIVSMMWVGLAVGCLLCGKISQWMQRRKPVCIVSASLGVTTTLLLLYAPITEQWVLSVLFFCIGMSGGGMNIGFALTVDIASDSVRATALGLNNTVQMLLASILPPLVTLVVRYFAVDGVVQAVSFQKGLVILPVCFLISLLTMIFGVRETFCRQQGAVHKITYLN